MMASRNALPRKGHRYGGPLRLLLIAAVLAGCGGPSRPRQPAPARGGILRPLEVYQQLGLLAGSERFPAVASFSTIAGPGDSTYVLYGLSLPNSALMFQRDGAEGFVGRYTVSLSFLQDGKVVRRVDERGVVRVPTFAETGRTDESVVFQTAIALPPGRYSVEMAVRDAAVPDKGIELTDTLDVPAYRAGGRRLAGPVLVYRATGRASDGTSPELIVNPRHTIAYGGDAPRIYVEGYGFPAGQPLEVRIVSEDRRELWRTVANLEAGDGELAHALVEIPTADLPLGKLWVETGVPGDSTTRDRAPLLVTISDQWMVANFEEVLEFLRYIATDEELDSLKATTGAERTERWERFWARRDPVPATATNEFRERFFERVRLATLYFGEPGRPGWKTDRGEVFIVLGPPDNVIERHVGNTPVTGRPNAYEWVYESGPTGRLVLTFIDRSGFERYELTPSSESAFRSAASRLKRPN